MQEINMKISFNKDSKKTDVHNNKVTVVTLTGYMEVGPLVDNIHRSIWKWATDHPSVNVDLDIARMKLILKASGKSTCTEGDEFNPVYGERIAEARAKIKLYKFMYKLLGKVMMYHRDLLFGNCEIGNITSSHSKSPKSCLYTNYKKYLKLWGKECIHLDNLLSMS